MGGSLCSFSQVLSPFASLFSKRIFRYATLLLMGAILAPGRRTVTAVLRVMGLAEGAGFQNYHRVLNRAVWCARSAAWVLLRQLVDTFAPEGPLVFGLDDMIERRWGAKIQARCLALLAPVPWAGRIWALPFLTALCPSERYALQRGRRHKTPLDWARQMVLQLRRWLPEREIILVGDNTYAALEWLDSVPRHITVITRLRLDAALYEPAPPRKPGTMGRPRKRGARLPTLAQMLADPTTEWRRIHVSEWYGKGERELEIATATALWFHGGLPGVPLRWVLVRDPEGKLEPKAFLSGAVEILRYFVWRWQIEVTVTEVRRHLGVETQRQWSDLAIARTTPTLLGPFSLVTLTADRLYAEGDLIVRQASWYEKPSPTFSDALAAVRRHLWRAQTFFTSPSDSEI